MSRTLIVRRYHRDFDASSKREYVDIVDTAIELGSARGMREWKCMNRTTCLLAKPIYQQQRPPFFGGAGSCLFDSPRAGVTIVIPM